MWIIAGILLSIFGTFYLWMRRRFNYWKKRNVPHLEPLPLFGNYKDLLLFKSFPPMIIREICKKFPNEPYVGSYYGTAPALIVKDPEMIKLVTTKDFYYFSTREIKDYIHMEVQNQNLFNASGDTWKVVRQNLTPLFSSAKMKNMFYLIQKCSKVFERLLENMDQGNGKGVEVTALMGRYTIDCISSCAFGVDTDALGNDVEKNPFVNISGKILEASGKMVYRSFARVVYPRVFYGLGFKAFNVKVNDFFHKFLVRVFESRQYKPTNRNDFIDLMLGLKNNNNIISGDSLSNMKTGGNKKVHLELDDELLVAQCIVLFLAGYETSAYTSSYALYELAKNQEAQKRAMAEVDDYMKKHPNGVEYDCVTDLPYLTACINETMRMYPVIGMITREVVENYTLPTGLELEKGMKVHIPVQYLHYEPKYFPEPERYRPERFLDEEKDNIVPFTYLPFGEGPRLCIGSRFSKMQIMAAMVPILHTYRVELADGMPHKLEMDPKSALPHPVGGIHLKFKHRN